MRNHRISRTVVALGFSLGLGLIPSVSTVQAGPSAREIMEKVTASRKVDGSEATVKMKIISEKGETRERDITMATKLYDGGQTEKRLYRFLSPADVKGTGVLVYDYDAKSDEMWIFLPALRKSRRIVSSQRSEAFMGSEFSFGDLNIPPLDEFNYTLQKNENYSGEDCYVIDAVPKSDDIKKAEGYSKKTYWVSTKTLVARHGLFYDLDGKVIKEYVASDVKLLDPKKNRYRAMKMEITNKQNGRKSVFETTKCSFSPDTKDEYFTTAYLERT